MPARKIARKFQDIGLTRIFFGLRSLVRAGEVLLAAVCILPCGCFEAGAEPGRAGVTAQAGDDLFARDTVHELRLEITPDGMESLRANPRKKVAATAREGERTYDGVSAHLKGSTGSFQKLDDKPSFTLWFNRSDPAGRFHGLREIHLNNSLEDPSLLNEELGGEWFRSAGVPAPRVTHARVTLNGRSLGVYVLTEGFTEDFLARFFKQTGGNLYEPESGGDIDSPMKLKLGVENRQEDRKRLAEAALDPDPSRRWLRLTEALDMERVMNFMAVEIMIGHRDGYSAARNNFRLYHDLDSNRMLFLPHGMDQLLQSPDFPWEPVLLGGLVARQIVATSEGRARYEEAFRRAFANVYQEDKMTRRVRQIVDDLAPKLSRAELAVLRRETATVTARIAARHEALERALKEPVAAPMTFERGASRLENWVAETGMEGMALDRVPLGKGGTALRIRARTGGGAAWIARVLLPRGVYRFHARCKVVNVTPLKFGAKQGAGVRIGGKLREAGDLVGTTDWKELTAGVEVAGDPEWVECKCELLAERGEAWFDRESLILEKLGGESKKVKMERP